MWVLRKVLQNFLGNKNEKDLHEIRKYLKNIKNMTSNVSFLSNDELRNKTSLFKSQINSITKGLKEEINNLNNQAKKSNIIDVQEKIYLEIDELKKKLYKDEQKILLNILPEAFLVMQETTKRFTKNQEIIVEATEFDHLLASKKSYVNLTNNNKAIWKNHWDASGKSIIWDMIYYDVQFIGGIVLHQGKIAEMATGEGKTFVATLPIYLNALTMKGVHVVTVNDYLSKRDSSWIAPILEFHGLSVDCIDNYPPNTYMRKNAYKADITYGTNNEFGFDYLRDNMVHSPEEIVQRELNYAIIDEIDSVLIDDARTPLIISGPTSQNNRHEFDSLKPKIERIVQQQYVQINKIYKEARAYNKSGNKQKCGFKLLQLYRGLPKYKPLIKFLSEKNIRVFLQKTELEYLQDNQRNMSQVDKDLYFVIDEKNNTIELTDKGIKFLSEDINEIDFFILPDISTEITELENKNLSKDKEILEKEKLLQNFFTKSDRIHTVNQLLKAYTLFENDVEYVILDGQVKIVDEQTGRIMEGRRYSDGLHQAIEAKENVKIENTTQTFSSITLQNYFRMYKKLSGMTGTAETEASEFWQIYNLDVIVIPTNTITIRKDKDDLVFKTIREKYNAIIEEIIKISQKDKRPVLVGTTSVEISELLSRMLKLRKISFNALNAKLHKKEADIISKAGFPGVVTIATNMAGRGTDIKLSTEVQKNGGLAIIGTERHDSRRIDRQLRGRAGRQGDPGTSQFYVSLEDNLMRLFIDPSRLSVLMDKFGYKDGDVIQHSLITKSIERAQKKIEENNFNARKRLLEYDDVMNKQRLIIYQIRKNALFGERINIDISIMIDNILSSIILNNRLSNDFSNFKFELMKYFSIVIPINQEEFFFKKKEILIKELYHISINQYKDKLEKICLSVLPLINNIFLNKFNQFEVIQISFTNNIRNISVISNLEQAYKSKGKSLIKDLERTTILTIIDEIWKEHLQEIDDLRQSVQNAIYEQKSPLLVYKGEAFNLFQKTVNRINQEIISFLFRIDFSGNNISNIENIQKIQKNSKKIDINNNLDFSKNVSLNHYNDSKIRFLSQETKKIRRNDYLNIRHINTGEIKKLKYKQIKKFTKSGNWIIEKL